MDGLIKLRLTHRRLVEEILRAPCDLTVDDAFNCRQVVIDSDIDDAQLEPMLATEHIHAATTLRKILHLLPGHLTGRNADALPFNAVIASEEQMTGVGETGCECLLDQTHLHGDLLQTSQSTLGLVQIINLGLDGLSELVVNDFYLECSHLSPFLPFLPFLPFYL